MAIYRTIPSATPSGSRNMGGHARGKMGTPALRAHMAMSHFFATDHVRVLLSLIPGSGPIGQIGFSLLRHWDIPREPMVIIKQSLFLIHGRRVGTQPSDLAIRYSSRP